MNLNVFERQLRFNGHKLHDQNSSKHAIVFVPTDNYVSKTFGPFQGMVQLLLLSVKNNLCVCKDTQNQMPSLCMGLGMELETVTY